MKINIINKSNNPLPEYANINDSGLDLRAYLNTDTILYPHQRKLINTGIYIELPTNYEIQVRPRSGLAIKHGITVLNTPGTVDNGYTGEICIILINLSEKTIFDTIQRKLPFMKKVFDKLHIKRNNFIITNGMKIAQMVLNMTESKIEWNVVNEIEKTDSKRGNTGFGNSGIK